jgi:glycerol-3-phosphate dehydrogenase
MPIRFASRRVLKPLLYTSVLVTAGGGFLAFYSPASGQRGRSIPDRPVARSPGELRFPKLKSREEHISDLRRSGAVDGAAEFGATQSRRTAIVSRQSSRDDDTSDSGIYDLLIIGGGATGTGIALDAVTRGLKVALVERDDFSSGTSSKSTKLVHGGVRYLEKAVWNLDYNQYKLVKEALRERKYFLDIAPHLSSWLPTILPIRRWYEAPYLWAGTKLYDLLAGSEGPKGSYYLSKSGTMAAFPTLDGTKIVGSLVYHDGQHNDSRMNVSLAVTAALYGATVVNHLKVTALEKDNSGKVCGAQVQDQAGPGDEFLVRAKGIINATGPFSDSIRQMDEPTKPGIVAPSSGVHIVLPSWLGPENMGIIDPSSDGRVIFLLPWEGKFIAGTTDMSCEVGENPIPAEQEVGWILREVGRFMDPGLSLQRSDVLAAWSGLWSPS